jgi:hypothetical protein
MLFKATTFVGAGTLVPGAEDMNNLSRLFHAFLCKVIYVSRNTSN